MDALRASQDKITFPVHDVEKATAALKTWKTRDGISALLYATDESKKPKPSLLACSGYNSDSVADVYQHPLFHAVHLAFSQHRPLVLSPDMIWVSILQGLTLHIRNNSETLRSRLVSHEGKIEICVTTSELAPESPESSWDEIVADFSKALSEKLGTRYDVLIPDFSTTGPVEKTVCEIALMDAFQPYFTYAVYCICGIPSVTLEGRPDDWLNLRKKVEALADYDLDWWLADLKPILEHFELASSGRADIEFWKNIYKQTEAYGAFRINGWITRFVPYLRDHRTGNFSRKNDSIGTSFTIPAIETKNGAPFAESPPGAISMESIPHGLSVAPFVLKFLVGEKQSMQFVGGFVGIEQDEQSLALRPKLGWAVYQCQPEFEFLDSLAEKVRLRAPLSAGDLSVEMERLTSQHFAVCVPNDFIQFYKTCDGFDLPMLSSIRFLPLKEVIEVDPPSRIVSSELEFDNPAQVGNRKLSWVEKLISHFAPKEAKVLEENYGPWVKVATLSDGNFVALHLSESDDEKMELASPPSGDADKNLEETLKKMCDRPRSFRVCKINASNNEAQLIARSFMEFVRKSVDD